MAKKAKQARAQAQELKTAAQELGSIRDELDAAYRCFNATTDPDALSACIFEIGALRTRYNLALRQIRARQL